MNATSRHFTLADANRALPLVRMIVRDIVELFPDVRRRRERLTDLQTRRGAQRDDDHDLYVEELRQMEDELDADDARLQEFLQELDDVGVELTDPMSGVVDFPALMDGREVCLSWQLGEPEIEFWHEVGESLSERRPLGAVEITDESRYA